MLAIAIQEELMYIKNSTIQRSPRWLNGGQRWAMQETQVSARGLGRSMRLGGEGSGPPLQCSCLENPMDGGAWWAAIHGVSKIQTRLSDFTFTFHFHALEKEMATHSRVLAWRIPGTGEPGGLPSMGSHRVGHDRSDLAAAGAYALGKLSPGATTADPKQCND